MFLLVSKNGRKNGKALPLNLLLDKIEIEILLLLISGPKQNKDLSRDICIKKGKNAPVSTISRKTTHLSQIKLIGSKTYYNEKCFELTPKGKDTVQSIVTGGWCKIRYPIRQHCMLFKLPVSNYPIEYKEKLTHGIWARYCPRNWDGFKRSYDGCVVVFTPKNVLIYPPPIFGPSPENCFLVSIDLVMNLKEILEEENPKLQLGCPNKLFMIIKQSYAHILDPISLIMSKFDINHHDSI